MTDPLPSEDITVSSDRSLKKLAWAIEASQGQFKLILARCNYVSLRSRLVERLQELCSVEIRILVLKESDTILYATIRAALGENMPAALMVLGLESVRDIEQMLTSSNQVREEFRKKLPFPLVLWVNDEVLKNLMRLASDFESWATTVTFVMPPEDLENQLRDTAEQWFTNNLTLTLEACLELEAAYKELLKDKRSLNPELVADCESLLGFAKRVNHQIDAAIEHYQRGLVFWQQTNTLERQAKLLDEIAFCYYLKAPPYQYRNQYICQDHQHYVQEYLRVIEQINRPDLMANSILRFSEFLGYLQDWEQLKRLAQQALTRHEAENKPIELARDYGFLAEAALAQECWKEANQFAQKALEILSITPRIASPGSSGVVYELPNKSVLLYDPSLYLFILAKSQQSLGQLPKAIRNLEVAREVGSPECDPQLYLDILCHLQQLYFQEKDYLKAFEIKQKRQSIEQQYGLRAFIGAGRIQSQRQFRLALQQVVETGGIASLQESVAPEIRASGRQLDVERLIERIGRNDYKLIVIHGQSGVGKSSLVTGGLVPALKQKAIGTSDVLPVLMRVYTSWVGELGRLLVEALEEQRSRGAEEAGGAGGAGEARKLGRGEVAIPESVEAILEELQQSELRNLRIVLIFDQFEEFFFVYPDPVHRRQFFEFVGECLNILPMKVILSLREDYLHYLLECNYLDSMKIIGNDILTKNVLYPLGNFSPADAKVIIQRLTEHSYFHLELALVEELVQDLADELGKVRPIELQIVGAQLQTENITTLTQYRECGQKVELVKRYLAEVVKDCGAENQQVAELVLYLLTDEKGTRPLKTRAEVERDLQALASADLTPEVKQLDLVFKIFVDSGLVVLLKEFPADRYQLVHDYLAEFIRQQQAPKLNELMAELEAERKQRKLSDAKLNQFLKRALMGSMAGIVVLVVVAGFAVWQWRKAENEAIIAKLGENAATVRNMLPTEPLDALVLAIKSTGESQDKLKQVLPQVQSSLYDAIGVARERYSFKGLQNWFNSVAISPDGKTIATVSFYDRAVRLWNLEGDPIGKPLEGFDEASSVAFSPNGQTIAVSRGNKVELSDLKGNAIGKPFEGHKGGATSVAFSPDGKYIVSGSKDNTLRLWDLKGNSVGSPFRGHKGGATSVAFSPDGKYIVSGSKDNTLQLWDLKGNSVGSPFRGHKDAVNSVAFSPDGKYIVSGSDDKTVRLWDLNGNPIEESFKGHEDTVNSVAFSPDGKYIVSGSNDNTVRLWDLKGNPIGEPLKGRYYITSLAITPDGKTIVTVGSHYSTVRLWDFEGNFFAQTFKGHKKSVTSVAFSPDGKYIVSGGRYDNTVRLWDIKGNPIGEPFKGHEGFVTSVTFSPDGQYIVSGSYDKTVRLWDIKGNPIGKPFKGHKNVINSVAFSPDGKYIISGSGEIYRGSGDNTVRLWDIKGNPIGKPFKGHKDAINSVAFSPNGKYIASGGSDITVRLWDIKGNPIGSPFKGHKGVVTSVAFSPDGKYIVSGGYDKTVRLWNLKGNPIGSPFKGHEDAITSVAFSPDGKYIVSGGYDKTVRLWNLKGNPIGSPFKGHEDGVASVAFSRDGKYIVSGGDNTLRLWRGGIWQDWLKVGCNRLRFHPVLLDAQTEEAKAAGETCQKYVWSDIEKAQFLVKQGQARAQEGDLKEAEAKFKQAQQLDSSVVIPAETKIKHLAANALVKKGKDFVNDGKVKEALAAYIEAQKLAPNLEITANSWNSLCWDGSLQGYAADVMFACEKAVALAPDNGGIRDSRGVARALTGNTKGAIEDFQAFIAKTDNQKRKAQRQRWVNGLRAGKNPFTPEEIKSLLK